MTVPTSVAADATRRAPMNVAARPALTFAQKACEVSIQRRNSVIAMDPDSDKWIGKWNVRIPRSDGTTVTYYYCIDASDDAEKRKIIPRLFGPRNIGTSLMVGTTPLVTVKVGTSKKIDTTLQILMADSYCYLDLVRCSWENETELTSMEKRYPFNPQPRRPEKTRTHGGDHKTP